MKSQEEGAIQERINRRYEKEKVPDRWLKLHKARGEKNIQEFGEYFTREEYHSVLAARDVDIRALAKELGVL